MFYPPLFSFFSLLCPVSCLFFLFIYIAYILIFLTHFYHFFQAAVAIKISNFFICFCRFDLSCPILEQDSFIENLYIVLSCLIKERSFLTLFVSCSMRPYSRHTYSMVCAYYFDNIFKSHFFHFVQSVIFIIGWIEYKFYYLIWIAVCLIYLVHYVDTKEF